MAVDLLTLAAKLTLDKSGYDKGLSEAESSGSNFASKMTSGLKKAGAVVGTALTAASAATVKFAKDSVDAGKAFDASMAQVAATMGKPVSEIQNLRDFALQMGSSTAFSASQAADALNYMALAGYDAEKSMAMLPNVLNLAAAGGIDLGYASDMVTDAQSALGLSMDETTQMVDKMAKTASKSNTSVSQLGEAILTIGGTAKIMKGGTTELSTALGILADNGIKGAEGGTHLRNILLGLSAPTDKATKELKRLGIQTVDAKGNMLPLETIMGKLDKKLSKMGEADKAEIINKIFNKTDIAAVNALLNTSTKRWEKLSAAIDDSQNSASEMAKTQLDNLAGDITIFKSALEGAQIAISDVLTPSLREFVQFGTEGLQSITEAFKADGLEGALDEIGSFIGELASRILDGIDKILPIAAEIIKSLASAIIDALPMLGSTAVDIILTLTQYIVEEIPTLIDVAAKIVLELVKGITSAIPTLIPAAVSAIKQIINSIRSNLPLFMQAGIQLIKTLAQAIIDALPELMMIGMELIMTLVEAITENIGEIATTGMEIMLMFINTITEHLPELLTSGIEILTTLINGVIQALPTIISAGLTIIEALVTALQDNLPMILVAASMILEALMNGITELLPILAGVAISLITTLVDYLTENLPMIINMAISILDTLISTITENLPVLIEAAVQIITALVNGLVDNLPAIIDGALTIITSLADALIENLQLILDAAVTIIIALAEAMVEAIPEIATRLPAIIDAIVKTLVDGLPKLVEAGVKLLTSLIDKLPKIITTIVEALPQIITAIVDGLEVLIPQIIDAGVTLFTALIENLPTIIEAVAGALPEIVGGILEAITTLLPQIVDGGVKLFTALIDNLPTIIETIVNAVPDIVNGIVEKFDEYWETIKEVGTNILNGIWDGISSGAEWLKEQITGWVGDILGFAKRLLGIHSPSTVMRDQVGLMMGKGVAEGILDSIDDIEEASNQMLGIVPNGETDFSVNVRRNLSDSYAAGMDAIIDRIDTIMQQFSQTITIELDNREFGRAVRGYA